MEQSSTSAGGYATLTVALAVGLGAAVAVLIVVVVVGVFRLVHASRQKKFADRQHSAAIMSVAGGCPARVTAPLPSWGFESIRSPYSIIGEDSVDPETS